jgi:triacylglycerol lipase
MAVSSSLARLLRAGIFLQFAVALAWLAWRWPASPALALGGAVAILLVVPAVLAGEFLILGVVARKDTVPAPTATELAGACLGEIGQLVRVFYGRQAFAWRAVPDHLDAATAGRRGVVFIHGFVCNRGFWSPWMQRLRANGQPFVAVNLEPLFTSIDNYAAIIDDAVRRVTQASGLPPVLICHSMGGVAARAWLRQAGDTRRVHHLVTIGTPHHGTWLGQFSHMPNGRQMRLQSDWLHALAAHEAAAGLPPCTSWYTNCDNIVFPTSTAILPGADNRLVRGPAHVDLGFREEVIAASLALAAAPRS